MRDLDQVFEGLARSPFRRRFYLPRRERGYLEHKGLAVILDHAADFIEKRLAPADPPRDGRQTPYRNHPVFIAQHATATCCRNCLWKWHAIPKGRALGEAEKRHVLSAIERWLRAEAGERLVTERRLESPP